MENINQMPGPLGAGDLTQEEIEAGHAAYEAQCEAAKIAKNASDQRDMAYDEACQNIFNIGRAIKSLDIASGGLPYGDAAQAVTDSMKSLEKAIGGIVQDFLDEWEED